MTQRRTFSFLVENRSKAVSFFFLLGATKNEPMMRSATCNGSIRYNKEFGYKEMLYIKNSVKKLMFHRFLPG